MRSTFRGKDPPFSASFSMVRRHCYPGTTNEPYISTYGVELCTVFWRLIHVQFSRRYIFNVEFWPLYFLWMYSFDPYIDLNVESWPLYFMWKFWPPTCICSLNVEFWPLHVVWIWTWQVTYVPTSGYHLWDRHPSQVYDINLHDILYIHTYRFYCGRPTCWFIIRSNGYMSPKIHVHHVHVTRVRSFTKRVRL